MLGRGRVAHWKSTTGCTAEAGGSIPTRAHQATNDRRMPAQSQSPIGGEPLSKGRGVAGHLNVMFATQIGHASSLNSRIGRACSTAEVPAVAVQSEPVRERIITAERATTFFYSTLFIITQGAWVSFLVWIVLKIT